MILRSDSQRVQNKSETGSAPDVIGIGKEAQSNQPPEAGPETSCPVLPFPFLAVDAFWLFVGCSRIGFRILEGSTGGVRLVGEIGRFWDGCSGARVGASRRAIF